MDPNLIFLIVGGGAMAAVMVYNEWRDTKRYPGIAPPREPKPVLSTATVQQQQRDNPWARMARTKGWPIEIRQIDPKNSTLHIRWGGEMDALYIEVTIAHSTEGATFRTRFGVPCRRPMEGLLARRPLLCEALSWQGIERDPKPVGKWVPSLLEPQELDWRSGGAYRGTGRLLLQVPANPKDAPEIRAVLRALRRALLQAQAPIWARLAQKQGWHMDFDASKTLPILAGTLDGVAFRATLRKTQEGLQTRITSIAVPATLALELPGLRVVHLDHGQGPSAELHHPIAGSMIHATGAALPALRALVNDAQVFGALMAVVHAYPGSSLSGSRIEVLVDRDLKLELMTAIQAVASLSKALQAHYTPAPEPGA